MKQSLFVFLIGFVVCVLIGPAIIKITKKLKFGQNISKYVENHTQKQGVPTMGGIIFLIGGLISFLIFNLNNFNDFATLCLLSFMGYGILGFLDDFLKIKFKQNEGLKAYQKFIGQVGIAIIVSIFIYKNALIGGELLIPFINISVNIGWWIIPFCVIFFVSVVNSVNLTDGLDGLAGGVSFFVVFTIGVLIAIQIIKFEILGDSFNIIQQYLNLQHLTFGVSGALLGYLVFNTNPAKIIMGDTGALAIGGFIASALSVTKLYLIILIVGIVYIFTTLSVIIQVLFYKKTKKRIFKMAPIHHHFQVIGYSEPKIVAIYVIATISICILCISLSL